jgi:FMN hydrolase / 5-amino-6-(5-phospho-D-ribitylamino)uracil phosphatase
MLDITKIKAISLDLDDTLWPVWPTIERAEKKLHDWLCDHAPMTAAMYSTPAALRDIRNHIATQRPELKNDLSAVRRESIRLALYRAKENPLLADAAFEVFFEARQQVDFYPDALPALAFLSQRLPLVSLSNGNADLVRTGLSPYFRAGLSAREFGVGKPDPRIFHAAAGALGTTPECVLHVGDDIALDVLGALNVGMQVAWVNRIDASWPDAHRIRPQLEIAQLTELCDLFQ